jgi:hypothetical protein
MRPEAQQLGDPLMGPRSIEDDLPGALVAHPVIKIIGRHRP